MPDLIHPNIVVNEETRQIELVCTAEDGKTFKSTITYNVENHAYEGYISPQVDSEEEKKTLQEFAQPWQYKLIRTMSGDQNVTNAMEFAEKRLISSVRHYNRWYSDPMVALERYVSKLLSQQNAHVG